MKKRARYLKVDVDFIRLFFPSPAEEPVAVHLAGFFGSLVGGQIAHLRPDTTMKEILDWLQWDSVHTVEFVMALEEQFGVDLEELGIEFDEISFRELVQHVAKTSKIRV